MYTHHTNGLGEVPAAGPSLWDKFSKIVTTGTTAGFNIYDKVRNLTQQRKATQAAQTQAQQLAQYSTMRRQIAPGQPGYGQSQYEQQSGFMGGWTMPLLLAGAALVGVALLRKK